MLLNVSSSCIVNVYIPATAPVPDLLKTAVPSCVSLIEKYPAELPAVILHFNCSSFNDAFAAPFSPVIVAKVPLKS